MTFAVGSRLGPFEVVAPLGAGGMGEVVRARDTRLDRDVAIKVLPESFASDPDRRARFEREARAIAALSHPNILVVYDTGVDDDRLFDGRRVAGSVNAGCADDRRAGPEIVLVTNFFDELRAKFAQR